MKIKKFKIQGLYMIKPQIFRDNRGYFFESFNKEKYIKILGKLRFVQDDHSFSNKGVLRGIHFQYKRPQAQLYYLASGKIFLVLVDFRPNSPTFLKHISLVLDSKLHHQIYAAPGIGSGFYAIDNNIHLIYKISRIYKDTTNEIGIRWNDPILNIKWPCKKPILSDKDKNNFFIKDVNFKKIKI